nr:hypothetical protein [Suid alphaherpesvirus 1]WEY32177.1 hypothetical protein [Suid alphaherpesvirus 1]WEY32338.1 hypothetical protein [Suid alphaherpesvirus 1]
MAPARAVVGSGPSRGGSTAPGSESGATDPPLSPLGPSPPRGACDAREPPAHNTPAPPPPSSSPLSTDTLALGPHAPVLRRHPPSLPASRVLGTTAAHPDGGGTGTGSEGGGGRGGGEGNASAAHPVAVRGGVPATPSVHPSVHPTPFSFFRLPSHGTAPSTPHRAVRALQPSHPPTPPTLPPFASHPVRPAPWSFEDGRGATVVRGEPGGSSGPRTLRAHAPLAHHTPPHIAEVGRERAPSPRPRSPRSRRPRTPTAPPFTPPASPRSLRAIAHTTPARMLGFFTRRTPWAADGTVSRRPPCACVGLSRPRVSAWPFCWSGCEKGTLMRPPLQRSSSAARSSTTTTTSLFSPALPHRPPPPRHRPRPFPTPPPPPPLTPPPPHTIPHPPVHPHPPSRRERSHTCLHAHAPLPPRRPRGGTVATLSPAVPPVRGPPLLFPLPFPFPSPFPPVPHFPAPSTIDSHRRASPPSSPPTTNHHLPPPPGRRPAVLPGARSHSQPGGFDGRPRGVDGDGRSGVIVCYQTAPPSPCPSSTSRRPAPRGAGAAGGWVGDRAGGRVWTGGGGGSRPLSLPSLPPSPTLSPCRLDERGRGRVRTDPPTRQARSLTLLLGSGWVPNPSPQDATDRCGERKMPVPPAPTIPDFSVPLPVAPSGPSSPGVFLVEGPPG